MSIHEKKRIHKSFRVLTLGFTIIIYLHSVQVLAQNISNVVPQIVVVQFEADVDVNGKTATTGLQAFDRLATSYGVHTIERMYPMLDHLEPTPKTRDNLMALRRNYYLRYSATEMPQKVSRDLSHAPGVVYAEPVPVIRTHDLNDWRQIDPNDPSFSEQRELNALNLPEAWNLVKGEEGTPKVVIAIVDGGGEWRHEDLRGNVWTNEDEIPNNGIDDDDNGYIDDVHGINLATDDTNDPTGLPERPVNARHGTAAAGAASAVTNNNLGIAGAAWNAELMHINAACPDIDRRLCLAYEGLIYAAMNGADIINASWGGKSATDEVLLRSHEQTLQLVTELGALVVSSAGNSSDNVDGSIEYPALHPRVLSVGATLKDSRVKIPISNYGKLVNVFAPGYEIVTTGLSDSYITISGTSFSTPLIAGVAALVKTRFPDLSADALREQVRLASESIDAENSEFAGQLGRGFVNALTAVQVPTLPAVRVNKLFWKDDDGDSIIESGDQVTITINFFNHLADANQLQVELRGAESYPFVQWTTSEVDIGPLAGDDETEVTFEFTVAPEAPPNPLLHFFVHVRDGAFKDVVDRITLRVQPQLELDYEALRALYIATDGENWTRSDQWDFSRVPTAVELSRWFGITVIGESVDQLWMENNNLNGTLPPELAKLSDLQILTLLDNQNLTGRIPAELGGLKQLRGLYLINNSLSGSIPVEFGNPEQLEDLRLSGSSLSGLIPSELGNLELLQKLFLHDNSLSGAIPSEFGNLQQLEDLRLFGNSLSGEIPYELGNLVLLTGLRLHNNSLTGPIPSDLGKLALLKELRLDDNSLTGAIPSEFGNLELLEILILNDNSLSGAIPPELENLNQLQSLFLGHNSLSGSIPSELGNLNQLRQLSLGRNSLSGSIPPELGNLEHLEDLGLAANLLTGPVPPELGNLSKLKRLYLSANALTGELPRSLMQLDRLEIFDFRGQTLCAPADDEFQAWLRSIPDSQGRTCKALQFVNEIADQSFPRTLPITPLTLPEAQGGVPPIIYTLTPSLPTGLVFDSPSRTIQGIPVVTSSPTPYTFRATDTSTAADSIVFNIEVFSPVAVEQDGLPELFTVYENYPNPFSESTLLVVDLPWSATLEVDVFDLTGRNVLSQTPVDLSAGWRQSIRLKGATLPSGVYFYKIHAKSEAGTHTQSGRFVRTR